MIDRNTYKEGNGLLTYTKVWDWIGQIVCKGSQVRFY